MTAVLLLLFLLLWTMLSIVIWSLYNGISPMPTSFKAKKCLFDHLPKEVCGTIYELGSGWGTLALPLARRYPHCQVVGFESSPFPFWISLARQHLSRLKNLSLRRQNFFQANLSDAELIVCYLYPGAMAKLKMKFHVELKPGTWIISNTFAIPGWNPQEVYEIEDIYRTKIYVYRVF